MLLFFLAAIKQIAATPPSNNFAAIFASLMLAASTGMLTKKAMRKYKRRLLFAYTKQKFKSFFKRKSGDGTIFGYNKWVVILSFAGLFLLLFLLANFFTALAVTGLLFLMAWVYFTYLAPSEE